MVSLETPKTGDELILFAKDFLAFALSTTVLISIWYGHYRYFLRFGLYDKRIALVNSWLLIVVLFFVYPLKFIISFLLSYFKYLFLIMLGIQYDQEAFMLLVTRVSSWETLPYIMLIYSTGYIAIMLSFALFYHHAYKLRQLLEPSHAEKQQTYLTMRMYFLQCMVAVASVLLALISLASSLAWLSLMAGFVYFFIGPLAWLLRKKSGKKVKAADDLPH